MKPQNEGMTHSVVSVWEDMVEEYAEKYVNMAYGDPTMKAVSRISINYGAKFTEANAQYLPKVAELIEKNKDLISWLMRMSELRWDDATHAPNFKHCVESLNESIKALES